jgi:hypothetical protein
MGRIFLRAENFFDKFALMKVKLTTVNRAHKLGAGRVVNERSLTNFGKLGAAGI